MKLAKNFAAATLLVFVLSLTSFAGDQQTPGYVPPPRPSVAATSSNQNAQVADNVAGAPEAIEETSDALWYEALNALLSIF